MLSQSILFQFRGKCFSYGMPNFNSFIRFGMVSITCSFTDSTAAMVGCIMVIATDQEAIEESCDGITAAWVRPREKE